ncbi:MAG: hypothetical protein LBQ09_05120 [Acidobacteriaceae bacterium]|nr:hypothetical protein [Acidobacteriaceae bacterium]
MRPLPSLLTITCAALLLLCVTAPVVTAQSTSEDASILVEYEWRHEHATWHFANDSSFNTDVLVPHTYEQQYASSGHWLTAAARYAVSGTAMDTTVSFTPGRTIGASDIDTFFNPDGDVIRYGTDGQAGWHAWRIEHLVTGRIHSLQLRAGYRYRRDWHTFYPADIFTIHTNPPSTSLTPTTDREFTTTDLHQLPIRATLTRAATPSWQSEITAEYTPFIWARLTTELPDKYRDAITSDAKGFGAGAEIRFVRRYGVPLVLGATASRSWSYASSRNVSNTEVGVMAGVEFVLHKK